MCSGALTTWYLWTAPLPACNPEKQGNKKRLGNGAQVRTAERPLQAPIQQLFVFTLDDDELQADCSGPRGRPLCITLRWMTVWGGQGVFTSWGWLRRWTPVVTVCLPTEAGYKASILFMIFKWGTFFFRLVLRLIGAKCLFLSWKVRRSLFDSLVSMRRKWGQHLRNAQTSAKIDTLSADRLVKPGNSDSTGRQAEGIEPSECLICAAVALWGINGIDHSIKPNHKLLVYSKNTRAIHFSMSSLFLLKQATARHISSLTIKLGTSDGKTISSCNHKISWHINSFNRFSVSLSFTSSS